MTKIYARFFMGNSIVRKKFAVDGNISLSEAMIEVRKKIELNEYLYNIGKDIAEVIVCKQIQSFEVEIEHS